jgi:hypothetical protein
MTLSQEIKNEIKKYYFFIVAREVDGYTNLIEFNGDTTVEMIIKLLSSLQTDSKEAK